MTVRTRNWSYPSLLGRRNSKDEEKLLKQVSLILESFLFAVVSSVLSFGERSEIEIT